MFVSIPKGRFRSVLIRPKRMRKQVLVSQRAFDQLCVAQALLPPEVQLILTRGYEKETVVLRLLRNLGSHLFQSMYPSRKDETNFIFQHNGHAVNGDHIDVSVMIRDTSLNLLPFGVFTPIFLIEKIELNNKAILAQVRSALQTSGFSVHGNRVETLQIHCDLLNGGGAGSGSL